ncbi:hypothetical protein GEMRC1_009161 [Eukaryota sp. GEM-RC1]
MSDSEQNPFEELERQLMARNAELERRHRELQERVANVSINDEEDYDIPSDEEAPLTDEDVQEPNLSASHTSSPLSRSRTSFVSRSATFADPGDITGLDALPVEAALKFQNERVNVLKSELAVAADTLQEQQKEIEDANSKIKELASKNMNLSKKKHIFVQLTRN